MSFVEFLIEYYIYILAVIIVLVIGVIGFLVDSRNKEKKNKQDNSNNVINNYTLSVPKLVIKSNDTTIKGGKIKGDIYVESDGLILDDTKIEGNIYFKDKKNKDSFKLENTASVSGDVKIE